MEIILAETAGFCFGVKRALDCVYKEASRGKIYTYGPIIHNKEVTKELSNIGVEIIDNFENIKDGKVILRSHGVTPEIYKILEEKGIEHIDCTCPYVKKIHKIVCEQIKKKNKIVIIGDYSHPEIIAINGSANNESLIFNSDKEIDDFTFDLGYNYSIVVQTTFEQRCLDLILEKLERKNISFTLFNTICSATTKRQKEANEISKKVNTMIVIGDKNSANSNKLYEICEKNCSNTYFIETIHDLELNNISSSDKIGITAGASAPPATIKEALKLMNDLEKENGLSFEEMLEGTFVTINTGDIVKGTVIQVTAAEVSVNLGYKSDGIIVKSQFADDPEIDLKEEVKVGEEIEVYVIRVNDGEGNVLLSKKRVVSQKGMGDIEAAAGTDTVFQGKIIEVVKGGLIALVNGIRAFVPSSQISSRYVEDMNVFKGQELDFNILEVDRSKNRIIAGRKELARKQLSKQKEAIFAKLEVGQKLDGQVSRIVDFGAFVDLGGVDGLIHISELSWGRVKKVTDVLQEGQKITVNVLDINKEKEKISLSLRDADSNPWTNADEKYSIGSVVGGKVVRMLPFGAFVELEEGVDGLVHISQISTKRIEKPEDELYIGQIVTVKVTDIDTENKKISLSIRALEEEAAPESSEDKSDEVVSEEVGKQTVSEEKTDEATVSEEISETVEESIEESSPDEEVTVTEEISETVAEPSSDEATE